MFYKSSLAIWGFKPSKETDSASLPTLFRTVSGADFAPLIKKVRFHYVYKKCEKKIA